MSKRNRKVGKQRLVNENELLDTGRLRALKNSEVKSVNESRYPIFTATPNEALYNIVSDFPLSKIPLFEYG